MAKRKRQGDHATRASRNGIKASGKKLIINAFVEMCRSSSRDHASGIQRHVGDKLNTVWFSNHWKLTYQQAAVISRQGYGDTPTISRTSSIMSNTGLSSPNFSRQLRSMASL